MGVPREAFKNAASQESNFKVGMKLEAVDKRNPSLVRIASIVGIAGRQLKVIISKIRKNIRKINLTISV